MPNRSSRMDTIGRNNSMYPSSRESPSRVSRRDHNISESTPPSHSWRTSSMSSPRRWARSYMESAGNSNPDDRSPSRSGRGMRSREASSPSSSESRRRSRARTGGPAGTSMKRTFLESDAWNDEDATPMNSNYGRSPDNAQVTLSDASDNVFQNSSSRTEGAPFVSGYHLAEGTENAEELTDTIPLERKMALLEYVFNDIIGRNCTFKGPYGANYVTYLDYIASGKPLRCIENYLRKYVMPVYANTHTEVSFTAQQTSTLREEARAIIRESVNASEDDAVIFTGSGCTAAINKLIFALQPKDAVVFIGPYEHHSNILPWLEVNAQIVKIPQTKDGLVDLRRLHWEVQSRYFRGKNQMLIGSFSAGSNITGILTDVHATAAILHKYEGIVFFDYACAAPYVNIDMNPETRDGAPGLLYKDAIFISPHKFLGGPGTPGILVAKKYLFRNPVPHGTGGGTVNFVRRKAHRYLVDPESREEGGTPAIIESIRAGLVFKLKQTFTSDFLMAREEDLLRKALQVWSQTPNLIILGNQNVVRLPIFPLMFFNPESGRFLHNNFAAVVLNDVFGIQVRSGCACAGPYGMDLLGLSETTASRIEALIGRPPKLRTNEKMPKEPFTNNGFKPGFVRLNLPYFLTEESFRFVLNAINMVARHGWSLMPQYEFDRDTGNWSHKAFKADNKRHLLDVDFTSGSMHVAGGSNSFHARADDPSSMETGSPDYIEIQRRANKIFADALMGNHDVTHDQSQEYTGEAAALRWFMLPSEAASIIHKRPLTPLPISKLPFLPGAMARKMEIPVTGHPGRVGLDRKFPLEY